MKDLPKVFKNKIDKPINNNKNIYYSKNNTEIIDNTKSVQQKINEIFSSPNYVYKANVEITLKNEKITQRIIGRNKNYIITMDNNLIPIDEIIDIKSTKNR
ncbi:MAG: hypothetical protein Q4E75_03620 [bacterium]|nr:hypothetical protein [bacterium]